MSKPSYEQVKRLADEAADQKLDYISDRVLKIWMGNGSIICASKTGEPLRGKTTKHLILD